MCRNIYLKFNESFSSYLIQVIAKAPPAKRRKVAPGVKTDTPNADSSESSSEGEEECAKPEVGKKRKFSEITKSSSAATMSNGNGVNGVKPKPKNAPFRRVVSEEIEIPHEALRDNSYKSFDTWGAKASQDLIVTRGKGFRSEKTKKKRGSYRGGSINVGVNSIRFDSD
jgi:hypothetical protein